MTAPASVLARAHTGGFGPVATLASGPLSHPYFQHALLAGAAIAAACGLVGYFLVLRAQVFAGDALSHTAFTGALGALALGYDLRLGLYATCVVVALLLGTLGSGAKADDVAIGSLFSWILGLGVFFLTLYTTSRSTANGGAGTSVLFGSIFGLSAGRAYVAAGVAVAVCAAVLTAARPLMFVSMDPEVAAARGLPVRVLGYGFLVLVGVCAAEATQAIGSLLLLGLLAAPAGAAHRLTDRPFRALALAPVLAVSEMVVGLALAYAVPDLPPSFAIVATATVVFGVATAVGSVQSARRPNGVGPLVPAQPAGGGGPAAGAGAPRRSSAGEAGVPGL